MMVGALNMISVAFAVLFVGIGVDFAIQFSVRYRAERHDVPELRPALSAWRPRRSACRSRLRRPRSPPDLCRSYRRITVVFPNWVRLPASAC